MYAHRSRCECIACLVRREEMAGRESALDEARPVRKPQPGTLRAIELRYGSRRRRAA
jgi:hypothetical protein